MGTVVEDTAMVMAVADMATVTDMVVEVMGMDMAVRVMAMVTVMVMAMEVVMNLSIIIH